MQLIVIAHRGEAQEFIKNLHLKPDESLSGLYYCDKTALLISGEGVYEVLTKLPFVISKYDISLILNYGIAGALNQDLEIDQIVPIRTCYGFNESSPKFHSFTSTSKANFDCITTDQRVLTDEFAKLINPYATIVDRELWAIGKCSQAYDIPYKSFKLISDYAGAKTACFDIKEKALEYSEALFEEYLSFTEDEILEEVSIEAPIVMSFSNKIKYKKLIHALTVRENKSHKDILESIGINELKALDIRAKNKASLLIEKLDELLNPVRIKINRKLNAHFKTFTDIGAKIKVDPKLEVQKFNLAFEVNSHKNLENLKEAIDNFNFEDIEKLWNGEVDV